MTLKMGITTKFQKITKSFIVYSSSLTDFSILLAIPSSGESFLGLSSDGYSSIISDIMVLLLWRLDARRGVVGLALIWLTFGVLCDSAKGLFERLSLTGVGEALSSETT